MVSVVNCPFLPCIREISVSRDPSLHSHYRNFFATTIPSVILSPPAHFPFGYSAEFVSRISSESEEDFSSSECFFISVLPLIPRRCPFSRSVLRKNAVFALTQMARPSDVTFIEATLGFAHAEARRFAHLALRDFVNRLQMFDFSYTCYPSYTASDILP